MVIGHSLFDFMNCVSDGPTPVIWTTTGSLRLSAKCGRRGGSV
jgi:hypothetical protein